MVYFLQVCEAPCFVGSSETSIVPYCSSFPQSSMHWCYSRKSSFLSHSSEFNVHVEYYYLLSPVMEYL